MALGPTDPGVRLCVGLSKSGKSYSIRADVHEAARRGMPIAVVDSMHEWTSFPPDIVKRAVVLSRAEWTRANIAAAVKRGMRIVIVRTTGNDQTIEAADIACHWALRHEGIAGVAITEAWQVAPTSGIKARRLAEVTRAFRHRKVAAWLDAQRLTMISPHVRELCLELRCFAMAGHTDHQILTDIGTKHLSDAVHECARRYARGEYGWHVALGAERIGPYPLARKVAR